MIPVKKWHPELTSQYTICPIPFHLDLYRGCRFNCKYCFSRDFTTFQRRNRENDEERTFTFLEKNDGEYLQRWFIRVSEKEEHNYKHGEEVAFRERIPLKIGATADPFPPDEAKENVTKDTLRFLHEKFDYPTEIQTKNPKGLLPLAKELYNENPNWTVAVTLITTDENFAKVCEPNAPTPQQRLNAIKQLTDLGIPVMIKCQPAIYPKIKDDLPDLVKKISEAGVWLLNTEGLKIRVSMPKHEQKIMQQIGNYININLRNYYRMKGELTGSDYEMSVPRKKFYTKLAWKLCKHYGIKYITADNHMGKIGDGYECCGTEKLRDYKIWGYNERTRYWDKKPKHHCHALGKCMVNFCRSEKYNDKTLYEATKDQLPKPSKSLRDMM